MAYIKQSGTFWLESPHNFEKSALFGKRLYTYYAQPSARTAQLLDGNYAIINHKLRSFYLERVQLTFL